MTKLTVTSIVLPKCPHCGRLAESDFVRQVVGHEVLGHRMFYYCAEERLEVIPVWVSVQANEVTV